MSETLTITVLTPESPSKTAEEMWQENMTWVFEEPYLVALGRTPRTRTRGNRTTLVADDQGDICPVWGDRLPWKSSTVIVPPELEDAAAFCLACADGGGYSRRKVLEDGRVALRSDYQAW